MTGGATREEKIRQELVRRKFLQQSVPDDAETLVDFKKMLQLATGRAKEYRDAGPFPHVVIDDFLPEESYARVFDALPRLDDEKVRWGNLNANLEDGRPAQTGKYHLSNVLYMRPELRQLIAELNSGPFLVALQWLTGIRGLLADAQMLGGGVHVTKPGGLLRVHADFTHHQAFGVDRRLNLLIYLNPEWHDDWGGHLELWNQDMTECVERLAPIANRCVIFSTTARSFHGHPHPLSCPEGQQRNSIALYYYTVGRPEGEAEPTQATAWQDLPSERG